MDKIHISFKKKVGSIALILILIITPVLSIADSTNGSGKNGSGNSAGTNPPAEPIPNKLPAEGVMGGTGATSGLSMVSIAGIVAGSVAVVGLVAASASSDSDSSSTSNH